MFDVAAWLSAELEEDMGSVFEVCASVSESALFFVDKLKEWGMFDWGTYLSIDVTNPVSFSMAPGEHLPVIAYDSNQRQVCAQA